MCFRQSYSAHPSCQPSRLAIQTGKYPARFGGVSHVAFGGVTGGCVGLPKEEVSKTDKPFFLNMSYYAVHTPIQADNDKNKSHKNNY